MTASTVTARPALVASPMRRPLVRRALAATLALAISMPAYPTTPLADGPVFASIPVPGNVALALSVEYPTAVSVAHLGDYSASNEYLGYFDPRKCYSYVVGSGSGDDVSHFQPAGLADGAMGVSRTCTGSGRDSLWSGNFLNWATMQTIDPFRWVLTGGYRRVDTASLTILERAWASGQGGTGNFPNRVINSTSVIAAATPLSWSSLNLRVQGLGNRLRFTSTASLSDGATTFTNQANPAASTAFDLRVRVRVCDTTPGRGGVEANCVAYQNGNFKPEGLIQRYSNRMRFAALGYLNDDNLQRHGGVLRSRMKFVGPQQPVPGSPPTTNPAREWDSATGVFLVNPDSADATATTLFSNVAVNNSGVANYLNKFGQITPGTYKTFDPVGELYYAAIRYFKNLGDVDAWSSVGTADTATRTTWIDGFPVIRNWGDPILYSCQKNFILGIGDVNTHADRNLPGATGNSDGTTLNYGDPLNSVVWTNRVGTLQGITGTALGARQPYNGCCSDNGALMAGLAYQANTQDIRPDLPNARNTIGQTVQTFWLDILEYQEYKVNNQFYLASKFGGFNAPLDYNPLTRTEALPNDWWTTNGQTVGGQPRPDNYFTAGNPAEVVAGLTAAFERISSQIRPLTTSFATALPQVAETGNASYSARFDAANWTGELSASELSFDTNDSPTLAPRWNFTERLAAQLAGTGWDTDRRIATWNTTTNAPVAFRHGNLSTTQRTQVNPAFTPSIDDGEDLVNYLRGQRLHEQGSTATGSDQKFRARSVLLGDISGSKLRVVGPPSLRLSDATNPGYSEFRNRDGIRNRPTMVYFGANDGLLRGVRGDLEGDQRGREVFAYVPGDLYAGPSNPASPQTDGLQALANPNFVHRNYVNATPNVFDVDFARTRANSGAGLVGGDPSWQSVLIGGLGKGGRSYYAINVTNPGGITNEASVVSRVLWEFRDADLGYTFGDAVVVKTRQHGWVAVVPSGYNNADGRGYFFVVNPRNGALIQKIRTGDTGTVPAGTAVGSPTNQAGLAHLAPFFVDRTDGIADAVYGADLLGNVWRLDLTASSGNYPAPTLLARLTDGTGAAQPVTSKPLLEVDPVTNRRYVVVGTGRALDAPDLGSQAAQTFYAIADGSGAAVAATGPTGGFPVTRANLTANPDPATGVTLPSSSWGWYVDLGSGANGVGWRVINEATSFAGTVAFAAVLPQTSDPCVPSGSSRIYSINLASARSVLPGATDGSFAAFSTAVSGLVTDLRYLSVNGRRRLIAGSDVDDRQRIQENVAGAAGVRRLNWREVPVTD